MAYFAYDYFEQFIGQIVEVHLRRGDLTRPITGKLVMMVFKEAYQEVVGLQIVGPVTPDGNVQVHFVAFDAISHLTMVFRAERST